MLNQTTAFYVDQHECGHNHLPEITAVDVETWVKVMERIARETYEGKIKPGELDPEHIKKTYDDLSKGAAEGYGKNWHIVDETGAPAAEVIEMQKNIYRFSGAKNAEMLERINQLLTEGGKVKPWNQFKNEVLKLNKSYNVNYLQAEWQTANEAGRKAQIWKDYIANADLFPNLVYRTQEDDRVRPEHQTLEGIIKPIDHPFWNEFYPPNGWRCRCYTVQTAEEPTQNEDLPEITEKDVKPEFRNNVGKTGQIFKEDTANGGKPHPYFRLSNLSKYKDAFELTKLNAPTYKVKTDKGKSFKVNIFRDESDVVKNIEAAKTSLEVLNHQLNIRPHLDGFKNPEFIDLKGRWGDRVSPKWAKVKTATDNSFSGKLSKKRNGQLSELENTFIVLETNFKKTAGNIEAFMRQSWSKFNHYKTLDYVIYYFDGKAIRIERESLLKGAEEYKITIEAFLKGK